MNDKLYILVPLLMLEGETEQEYRAIRICDITNSGKELTIEGNHRFIIRWSNDTCSGHAITAENYGAKEFAEHVNAVIRGEKNY